MSDLVGNPEDRFSRVEAHMCMYHKHFPFGISEFPCMYMYLKHFSIWIFGSRFQTSRVSFLFDHVNHSSYLENLPMQYIENFFKSKN